MRAYILITAKPGTTEDILKIIKGLKGINVILADSVYGRFDAIVVIEAPDLRALSEMVYKMIGGHTDITHTETLITLF
ncbi:MAG: Lrp/AsnC ligand binding domain-containing protein [archaeon]|nr:Lrp/AsnC ligand binding domain-containing protein [archaeon]MCP8317665.1 Lrp/AsnC ligand binding domain-containing protein [archaeon]